MAKILASLLPLLATLHLVSSTQARAAELVLLCNIEKSSAGSDHRPIMAKLIIDFEARQYTEHEHDGSDWRPKTRAARLQRADRREIILEDNSGLFTYIDRSTGTLHAKRGKESWRGMCWPSD